MITSTTTAKTEATASSPAVEAVETPLFAVPEAAAEEVTVNNGTVTFDTTMAAPALLPAVPAMAQVAADKGKRLTPERKQKLDELGFVWSLRAKRIEDHWDQMFKQLLAYKKENGDCLVPSRFEANLKLGKWVRFVGNVPSQVPSSSFMSRLLTHT